jgi:hypothetical protein
MKVITVILFLFSAIGVVSAQQAPDCSQPGPIYMYKKQIQSTLDDVKGFTAERGWYVQNYEDNLWRAIRPSVRKKFAESEPEVYPCVSALLDEIAETAKRTLPQYKLTSYNVHNPAEERLIRSQVTDLSSATVFKVGLYSNAWNIQKNGFGIPELRYKHGAIWAKYPKTISDDGYCRIIYVNIEQQYAGGGTWGSTYGRFIKTEAAGCPAGK